MTRNQPFAQRIAAKTFLRDGAARTPAVATASTERRTRSRAMPRVSWALLGLGACILTGACMGAPLTNTPINTGADSTVAARKALEGTWRLLSLEVANADGKKATVQAEGELVLDAFANLKIIYRVAEAGMKALESVGAEQPTPVISTMGQVAIDAAGQKVTYVGADHSERAFNPILRPGAQIRSHSSGWDHTIGADGILTLKTRHDNGKDAATSRWQRAS